MLKKSLVSFREKVDVSVVVVSRFPFPIRKIFSFPAIRFHNSFACSFLPRLSHIRFRSKRFSFVFFKPMRSDTTVVSTACFLTFSDYLSIPLISVLKS